MSEKQYYLDEPGLRLYDTLIKQHIDLQNKVFYGTCDYWESQPDLVGKCGCIYIYSDWGEDPDGKQIAGFKIGDGETLLIDLAFTDHMYWDHINNSDIHVTPEDKAFWNSKVDCRYNDAQEKLRFYRDRSI